MSRHGPLRPLTSLHDLKTRVAEHRLSQRTIAAKTGISKSAVARLLAGQQTRTGPDYAARLEALLGVEPESLFGPPVETASPRRVCCHHCVCAAASAA